ncbi:glycosyltransferase family 2 protein [Blastococcus haudaquaticus]|uniref:Glycosyltransferase involved in cell wall bisynthesis n=1 Tax=Blastococcus haudaquaticus TaxID=1938745 RepID=A0A286GE90_9ACTN|nr:glycosyltransferase family 2 protein [Blastococcus haudaquaticus]SOD93827.1 Glycosyltransferase involved in cell wall bisynthesis [Blastococcus haudaquaticus]
MSGDPRVSIVIPAYQEGEHILPVLDRLRESVTVPCEVLVVVDSPDDATASVLRDSDDGSGQVRLLVNDYGRGPAHAIRYGVERVRAPVTVVTMADGCDDARQIDDLTRLVERGVVIAAASRYMSGGQQVGGPLVKGMLARLAGISLHLFARVGTRDPTNSFKAYSTQFLRAVGIDSRHGFEMALELTAKARRLRLPIAELPTIWLDRQNGVSNFKLAQWIRHYLRWYRFAFGGRLTLDELVRTSREHSEQP